jgi:hypothetical protein
MLSARRALGPRRRGFLLWAVRLGVLFAALGLPSLESIEHSPLGNHGVLVYLVVLFCVVAVLPLVLQALLARLGGQQAKVLGVLLVPALCVGTFVAIPLANRGPIPDGNVRDESLDLGVRELLAGRYPYYSAVVPQEPLTPLPALLFESIPFTLAGTAGWEGAAWFAVSFVALARCARDRRLPLAVTVTALVGAPVFVHELVSGSDLLANALWFLLLGLPLLRGAGWTDRGWVLHAVLFGLALSSRSHFLLLVLPFVAAVAARRDLRGAVTYAAVAMATFGVVTLPFYFYDSSGFSPLHVVRFTPTNPVIRALTGLGLASVDGLCALAVWRSPADLLLWSGFVLVVLSLVGIVQASLAAGYFEVGACANLGVSFLFLWVTQFWLWSRPADPSVTS